MITRPRFAALYVSDQDRALEFWSKTVGFDVQLDVPYEEGSDARWIEVKPPKGDTYIVLSLADETTTDRVRGFSNVWFAADDLDATYETSRRMVSSFPYRLRKLRGIRRRAGLSSPTRTGTFTD